MLIGCGPANHPSAEDLRVLVEDVLCCMRAGYLSIDAPQPLPMSEVAAAWRLAGEPGPRVVLTLD